jgi:exopolysaccharide biosynthesis polyprenyl glycosylphosphotransferase
MGESMYKRGRGSFYKHLDFLIADVLMLQLAFVISYSIRHGAQWLFSVPIYRQMSAVLFLIQMCVVVVQKSYKGIIRRGNLDELIQVIKYTSYMVLLSFAYMFVAQTSAKFSRIVFILTWILGIIILYVERSIIKHYVRKRLLTQENYRSIILVSEANKVESILQKCNETRYRNYQICGIVITDKDCIGEEYHGVRVIGYTDLSRDFMINHVVDEILLNYDQDNENIQNIVDTCVEMGLTIHRVIAETPPISQNTIVEEFAGYTVLTTSINMETARHFFIKRALDVVGGLVGVLITGILTIILGPVIYIKSPGPIFFTQERIGKNGRRFKLYKFRSMYMDAEERKKELMDQNEMQGLMFKIENDPRIIKGIGKFIRDTSLDEFPQFWNVLKGDMSLVGTRPPTVEEYEQYDAHHKRRMATKPGITGLWQVSGRSDITDFEEVVALDTKYIMEWSLKLDIKILLKTVFVVLRRDGSR